LFISLNIRLRMQGGNMELLCSSPTHLSLATATNALSAVQISNASPNTGRPPSPGAIKKLP
jgi:hypothetical protein